MAAGNSTSAVRHGPCLPETASRCFTESVTATHSFEVTNYPLLQGMGVGKFVSSTTFSVGGHDWNIRFYPDGSKVAGSASLFLYHLGPAEDVSTKLTFKMRDIQGKELATNSGELEHTFSPTSDNWGYPSFFKNSELKSSLDIDSGFLTISCILTIIKAPRTEAKRKRCPSESEASQPNLQDHLLQMLKGGEGADVTFSVCGNLFNAHRYLLAARSPLFKAELFGPMKEKETRQQIKIDDMEPPIFEELLHFLYTDSMLLDDEHCKDGRGTTKLQHLLVAVDRYGLDKLRVLCESKLCEGIDVETVATTLVLAEQHHCKDLKEACVEFMAPWNVLQVVMATDGFKHLVESCPVVMKEVLETVSRSG